MTISIVTFSIYLSLKIKPSSLRKLIFKLFCVCANSIIKKVREVQDKGTIKNRQEALLLAKEFWPEKE